MFKNLRNSLEQRARQRAQELLTGSWNPVSSVGTPNSSRPTTSGADTSSSYQEQPGRQYPQGTSTGSTNPLSVVGTPNSSRPMTPCATTSGNSNVPRSTDQPNSLSNVSPAEAASIIAVLKDKSADDLRKLLSDKDAYQDLLHSIEPVKTQNKVRDDLRDKTLQLARENLEKEPAITGLRIQCSKIRTTELPDAKKKLHELEKKIEGIKLYSPLSLPDRLQEALNKTDTESEALHRKLLEKERDLTEFVREYKKMRYTYHKRELAHHALKTNI